MRVIYRDRDGVVSSRKTEHMHGAVTDRMDGEITEHTHGEVSFRDRDGVALNVSVPIGVESMLLAILLANVGNGGKLVILY